MSGNEVETASQGKLRPFSSFILMVANGLTTCQIKSNPQPRSIT
jgi:hypothetical protein